jgi:protein-tyrosine phosphatase
MHVRKNEKVFFHCYSGVDRTGFVAAAWRYKRDTMSIDNVINDMKANGFHKWYNWWIPALRRYLEAK